MNYLDLFSGIGGFSLGFERAGFEFEKHYASEIDKYARSIYARQFTESVQLGDIRGVKSELGKIDIITGGFPCQSFSIAGKRGGFTDTRGTLFFEIKRLAGIYKPRYMVLENVKGLYSHDNGNTIRVILDELRRLDYTVQLLLLNTKDFNVPQNRERCFFICSAPGERRPKILRLRERKTEIDFSSNCIDAIYYKGIDNHGQRTCVGTFRTHKDGEGFREMQSGICPALNARARQDGSQQPIIVIPCLSPDRVEKRQNGRRFKNDGDPSFTLTAQDRHGIMLHRARTDEGKKLRKAYESGELKHGFNEHRTLEPKPENISGSLTSFPDDNVLLDISKQSQSRILNNIRKDVSGTLLASMYKGFAANGMTNVIQDCNIRRLTPTECERLQGFPDNWTKYGVNDELISDSQRYKCCGNAVTVDVIKEIAKAIKECL